MRQYCKCSAKCLIVLICWFISFYFVRNLRSFLVSVDWPKASDDEHIWASQIFGIEAKWGLFQQIHSLVRWKVATIPEFDPRLTDLESDALTTSPVYLAVLTDWYTFGSTHWFSFRQDANGIKLKKRDHVFIFYLFQEQGKYILCWFLRMGKCLYERVNVLNSFLLTWSKY